MRATDQFNNVPTLVRALAGTALLLCLCVVVLGAYVRLSSAGLGCPDWPGCYGHLSPNGAAADAQVISSPLGGRSLEIGKAWREMLHRYAAGTLGLLILSLAAIGIAARRARVLPVRYVTGLLAIVLAQALLGMLTVTRQLSPIVVTLHLLFGFATLALLLWLVLSLPCFARWWRKASIDDRGAARRARLLAPLALAALTVQIALGGWTSSNYAAVGCLDFPTCQAQWWPRADYREAFEIGGGSNLSYEGGVLDTPARTAIQFTHRLGALIAAVVLVGAAWSALRLRTNVPRFAAGLVLAVLAMQLIVGISMVVRGFPLWLATAHSAGAALLLMAIVGLNRALRPPA